MDLAKCQAGNSVGAMTFLQIEGMVRRKTMTSLPALGGEDI